MMRIAFLLLLGMLVACGGAAGNEARGPSTATAVTPGPSVETLAPSPTATPGASPAATPTGTLEAIPGPGTNVGGAAFVVETAITSPQRTQGLSGRPTLPPGSGMLFIFEQEGRHTFWMKEMRFPLDLVWIDAECTVVDVTLNAPPPAPGQTLAQLPRYSPGVPAQYVLEINAGEAGSSGIDPGDPVIFTGSLAGRYGC